MKNLDLLIPSKPEPAKDSFVWGTVTSSSGDPLRVRLDGDERPLPVEVPHLTHRSVLAYNARVWCQRSGQRVLVLGVVNGGFDLEELQGLLKPESIRLRGDTGITTGGGTPNAPVSIGSNGSRAYSLQMTRKSIQALYEGRSSDLMLNPLGGFVRLGGSQTATLIADGQIQVGSEANSYSGGDLRINTTGGGKTTVGSTNFSSVATIQGRYSSLSVGEESSNGRVWAPCVYDRTYSGSANMYVTSSGTFGRATSSRRYKRNIEDASPMPSVLDIKPKVWQQKQELDDEATKGVAETTSGVPETYFGAIAEDLDDLGLTDLVVYDDYGRPDGVAYDRVAIALIPFVKELMGRVEALEAAQETPEPPQA